MFISCPAVGVMAAMVPEKPEVTRAAEVSLGDIPMASACFTDTRGRMMVNPAPL